MNHNALNQIERGDLVDSVVREIINALISGRIRPGSQLVESQMGEQLGVSRGPVREAVRRLEQMGIVRKIPYRGTFVAELTTDDVRELHEVRAAVEGLAARLLAVRGDPETVHHLSLLLERMRQAPAPGEGSHIVMLDADFHDSLIALTGHRLLQELWATIGVRLRTFLTLKTDRLYATPTEAAAIHAPLVEAIASGDGSRAEEMARRHVAEAGRQATLSWANRPNNAFRSLDR